MPLLPSRRYATGGSLSLDPNDPTLPTDPVARQRELLRRQNLAGSGDSNLGSQVGQGLQQVSSLAGGTGTAGGGLAGLAGAAGPAGAALAAGAALGGTLRKSNLENDGLRATTTGGQVKDTLASVFDPIGNVTSLWGNKDVGTAGKIAGTLLPGLSSFLTKSGVDAERLRQRNKLENEAVYQAGQQSRGVYGGLAEATRGAGQYRRGGLLPGVRRFAVGGEGPKKPAASAPAPLATPTTAPPPVRGTPMRGNPEAAKKYYDNALATMQGLVGNKHDEVYNDPVSGQPQRANSCLSFACTVQEQATGQPIERNKQNLYNPEFTRTAEQQGWVPIDLKDAKPGDRLQSWQPVGTQTANEFKVQDLGGRQLIPGRVPVHMTVFGGWAENGKPTAGNPGIATVYQDGHQFRNADSMTRPIRSNEWIAYRYVGVNGQPTNDLQQAVAMNPAAVKRAKGGLLPKSVIAHGALHSEKNAHAGHATAGKRGIPVLAADGTKLAEVERDELTLTDGATNRLESLRDKGDLYGLGLLMRQELLHNTIPSPRYKKRLLPSR